MNCPFKQGVNVGEWTCGYTEFKKHEWWIFHDPPETYAQCKNCGIKYIPDWGEKVTI